MYGRKPATQGSNRSAVRFQPTVQLVGYSPNPGFAPTAWRFGPWFGDSGRTGPGLPSPAMRTNRVLDGLGTYPIAVIQERARAMRAAGEPLIDFSIGDPREPTPEFIREALRQAVPEVSQYPTTAGLAELRQAVARYVKRRFGVEVDPDSQVLPVAGSKEAIFSTPLAFVDRNRGDTVVWATPGYPIYERGALLAGAEGHPVRLGGDFVLRVPTSPTR